jgi:hypothetical protein
MEAHSFAPSAGLVEHVTGGGENRVLRSTDDYPEGSLSLAGTLC